MNPFSKLLFFAVAISISVSSVGFGQILQPRNRTIIIPNDNSEGHFRYHGPLRHINYRYENNGCVLRPAVMPVMLAPPAAPSYAAAPQAQQYPQPQQFQQSAESQEILEDIESTLEDISADREYRNEVKENLRASEPEIRYLLNQFGVQDPLTRRRAQ